MESPAPSRAHALDRFRVAAVLTMIQGHTFTALLAPDALGSPPPTWYVLWHGLTAPVFLVAAGLAYGHVRVRRDRGPARLARPLGLFLLGFALQLPGGSLRAGFATEAASRVSVALGPLSLVGLCLGLSELVRPRLGAAGLRRLYALALAALLACAPPVWSLGASRLLPLVPGTWLDGGLGSSFPVFPWAAFFAAGVLLAPLLASTRAMLLGGLAGALLMAASYGLWRGGAFPNDLVFWHASPLYVGFRLGACLVLLACAALLPSLPALGRALAPFARRSLTAYVVHLVILYGSPWSRGLTASMRGLSLPSVLVPSALVLGASWLACVLPSALRALSLWPLRALGRPAGRPAR